jgi:hypothetical protein
MKCPKCGYGRAAQCTIGSATQGKGAVWWVMCPKCKILKKIQVEKHEKAVKFLP